jgi:hypothetical protein
VKSPPRRRSRLRQAPWLRILTAIFLVVFIFGTVGIAIIATR